MKKIKFYKNIDDMEEDRIKEIIRMTPADRIKNTVELIKRIYPIRKNAEKEKKINIHR